MENTAAVPSLVRVRFPDCAMALTYLNDRFVLRPGDRVWVEGRLAGSLGTVTEVSYSFKIRPSAYKKVIGLLDTGVSGQLYVAGHYLVSFDPEVLPWSQVLTWLKAPDPQEEEWLISSDGTTVPLDAPEQLEVTPAIAERGRSYFQSGKVRYLCVEEGRGRAIVEGSQIYEVEFGIADGQILDPVCDCPCLCRCKHQVAALLQLRQTLELLRRHYPQLLEEHGRFAAIYKPTLLQYAFCDGAPGCITL